MAELMKTLNGYEICDEYARTEVAKKANASHEHAATDISSGTLPVGRGGTGKTTHTTNAILTGNGSSAVKNVQTLKGALYATSTNGALQFGTLPITHGGTGAITADAARTSLGITPANIGALPSTGGTITGNLEITGSTILRNTTDIGAGFAGNEPLIIGDPEGNHLAFDGTEIQCKATATTAGNLSINYDGGDVGIGNTDTDSKIYLKNPIYIPNETVIYGQDTDGTYRSVFSASSFNDNTAVGYDRYHNKKGNLNLYGDDIRLWSNKAGVTAQPLGVNQVLWTGGYLMTADHIVDLSAHPISSQINGVVLVWSCYSSGEVQNFGYATHVIPKWFVLTHGGSGMDFPLMRQSAGKVGSKYLYISDTQIKGQANNSASGTSNGITYDNGYWVLRAVIGF